MADVQGRQREPKLFGRSRDDQVGDPSVPWLRRNRRPRAAPYLFFRVDDMEVAVERVRELGGTVEETNVEGDEESVARWGRFKLCRDDQGSPFGLHQPPTGS